MKWTIRVTFNDGVQDLILSTESRPFKPDRFFGSFSDPKEAHNHLAATGWDCFPARTIKGDYTPYASYYRKGKLQAVITQLLVPEELTTLQAFDTPAKQSA